MSDEKYTITSVGQALQRHIDRDAERDKKTDAMYKILVVDNGNITLPETVRRHAEWIEEQKCNAVKDRDFKSSFGRSVVLIIIAQVVSLIGATAAVILELKR